MNLSVLISCVLCYFSGSLIRECRTTSTQSSPTVESVSGEEISLKWEEPTPSIPSARYSLSRRTASFAERNALPGLYFQGLGYNHSSSSADFVKANFRLSLRFRTYDENALLLYVGGYDEGDFVAVQLRNGHVVLSFHNGVPPRSRPVSEAFVTDILTVCSDGKWHSVSANKNSGNTATLQVDNNAVVRAIFTGTYNSISEARQLYLGGVPPGQSVNGQTTRQPLSGCLSDVYLEGESLEAIEKERSTSFAASVNVHSRSVGCPVRLSRGIHFKGAGYLKLFPSLFDSASEFKLKFGFRTLAQQGLLFALQGSSWDHVVSIEMENTSVALNTIRNSLSKSTVYSSPQVSGLCDGNWHWVIATVKKDAIAIEIDGVSSLVMKNSAGLLGRIYAAYAGGIEDRTNISATFDWHHLAKKSFSGCIRNLTINGRVADVENATAKLNLVSLAGCPVSNGSQSPCYDNTIERTIYNGTSTRATDSSIQPFTEYLYQVVAIDGGSLVPSNWMCAMSGPAVPVGSSIPVTALTNGSVLWTNPVYSNGLLNRLTYQILLYAYYPGSELVPGRFQPYTKVNITSVPNEYEMFRYSLDLSPFTEYSVFVRVVSPEGSDQSLPSRIRTLNLGFHNCYRSTDRGVSYRGFLSQTGNGSLCVSWKSRFKYDQDVENAPNAGLGDHNYCRNPMASVRSEPWCYISNESNWWGYCSIQECNDVECYSVIDNGAGYDGAVSRTENGKDCTSWPSEYSLDVASCRNPSPITHHRPWCFYYYLSFDLSGWKKTVAYCDIPRCYDTPVVSFTCNGTAGDSGCVFPFRFNGFQFTECTLYNSSRPWCATGVNASGNMTEWGYCLCPVPTNTPASATPTSSFPTSPFSISSQSDQIVSSSVDTATTSTPTEMEVNSTSTTTTSESENATTVSPSSASTVVTATSSSAVTSPSPTLSSSDSYTVSVVSSSPSIVPAVSSPSSFFTSFWHSTLPTSLSTSSLPTGPKKLEALSPVVYGAAGGAGGLVILTAAIVLIFCCVRRNRNKDHSRDKAESSEMKEMQINGRINASLPPPPRPSSPTNDYIYATSSYEKRHCESLTDNDGYLRSVSLTDNAAYQVESKGAREYSNGKGNGHVSTADVGIHNPFFAKETESLYETAFPSERSESSSKVAKPKVHDAGNASANLYDVIYGNAKDENEELYWEPAKTEENIFGQMSRRKYPIIDKRDITTENVIGKGEFGTVERGVLLKKRVSSTSRVVVAVKTLKSSGVDDRVKFLREAAIMGQFKHRNVVGLLGVVVTGNPLMMVLEFMANGDLKEYLVSLRPRENTAIASNIGSRLLKLTRDVVSGLAYLSKKRFVHRDLAARNIMLDETFSCKIGDFGLARDLADETYYVTQGGKIPVRWTAPEAVCYKKYSSASDVWSFGILLYEIWTMGERPYGCWKNSELMAKLETGYRLPSPSGCPREIYKLMIESWHPDHHQRITCEELVRKLSQGDDVLLADCGMIGGPVDLEGGDSLHKRLQTKYIE